MHATHAEGAVRATRATDVPWDVPVRLVPAGRAEQDGVTRVERVDPGATLPGVDAVEVTTVVVDGSELLVRVDPFRGPGGAPDRTLGDLLTRLQGPDGVVGVRVAGTAFTHDVLAALCRIPAGERRTYAELAALAGHPGAVRAAASVMARNRVPLVLPCHRVVPSGGGTGRYGWGETVKVALLAAEGA